MALEYGWVVEIQFLLMTVEAGRLGKLALHSIKIQILFGCGQNTHIDKIKINLHRVSIPKASTNSLIVTD
jgi:hypothetical protein